MPIVVNLENISCGTAFLLEIGVVTISTNVYKMEDRVIYEWIINPFLPEDKIGMQLVKYLDLTVPSLCFEVIRVRSIYKPPIELERIACSTATET